MRTELPAVMDRLLSGMDMPYREITRRERVEPRTNVSETPDGFNIEMLAPGYSKEDVKIDLENDLIRITAEKQGSSESEGTNFIKREFHRHEFERSFRLPDNANVASISAGLKDGILTINIPKKERETKQIQIM